MFDMNRGYLRGMEEDKVPEVRAEDVAFAKRIPGAVLSSLYDTLLDPVVQSAKAVRNSMSEGWTPPSQMDPVTMNATLGHGVAGAMTPMTGGFLRAGMAPRVAGETILGTGGTTSKPPGIRAYHGSPHDFDRFDSSRIGTGEGAQAYGHGLYFAENEGVAKSYRDVRGQFPIHKMKPEDYAHIMLRHGGGRAKDRQAAIAHLDNIIADESGIGSKIAGAFSPTKRKELEVMKGARQALIEGRENPNKPDFGHMYEVRINADPEDFLDWDKPLSQQSEKVKASLNDSEAYRRGIATAHDFKRRLESGESIFPATPERLAEAQRGIDEYGNRPAGDFVRDLPLGEGSKQLRDAGIPGIKYLDAGSRSAGEGSRNYVVFDDALIEILRKYGLLPLLAGGAGVAGSGQADASP